MSLRDSLDEQKREIDRLNRELSDAQLIIEERDAATRSVEYVETERDHWIQKCCDRDATIAALMRERDSALVDARMAVSTYEAQLGNTRYYMGLLGKTRTDLANEVKALEQRLIDANNSGNNWVERYDTVVADLARLTENSLSMMDSLRVSTSALVEARINFWAGATADGSISEAVFDDFVTGHNAKIDVVLAALEAPRGK